jgi:hypothetical protein
MDFVKTLKTMYNMAELYYTFSLAGTAALVDVEVFLEQMPMSVRSDDGGTTWRNKGKSVQVDVEANLQILMKCKSAGRSDYTFEVNNSDGNGKVKCTVFKEPGFTGDTSANYSEKRASVKPNC